MMGLYKEHEFMEERKTDGQEQELDQTSQEKYDLEERDEIPEQEKEMDEILDRESMLAEKVESNGEENTKEKNDQVIQTKPIAWKKIRIVAGAALVAVVCGIVWFNWHYAGEDLLYKTSNTPESITTMETETQEPTLAKEDVFTHYENLAIVDDKVDKYLNIRM